MQNAAYNPAGGPTSATLGLDGANQWTESRAHNSRLQTRSVQVRKGASTLLRLRWAYSGAYNSTTLEETGTDNNGDLRVERLEHLHQGALQTVDRTYAYTGADRLSYFAETGGKYQYYGHDAFGNVWQTSYSGVPSLRQTGSSWYLIGGSTVNNRLSGTSCDAMGNQTQLSVSAGTVASYDGENRMSKIAVGGAEIASYTYDAEGRRVAKTANGTTTYYFYDAAGQLMTEYGGPSQTAATHYFTTDYLGSTRMVLGATGNCLERLDYAPFGGQISRSGFDCYGGASSEKPLYTGQMRDGESTAGTDTGQDYFNARYFWANTARFTSPDAPFADQRPEDGQSWNMYAYVRNNPLRYVDLTGEAVADAGRIRVGTASFKIYRARANFDTAALLSTFWPIQQSRMGQLKQQQPSFWYPAQNNAEGGCVLGCATVFTESAVGVTLDISFKYDTNDQVEGAAISLAIDSSASFLAPSRPATKTTRSQMPGGLYPNPQVLRVDINANAFQKLTPQQLVVLAREASNLPVSAIRQALVRVIHQEQQRREDERKKREMEGCQSGQADCSSANR